MLYLLAVVVPPLAVLLCGKPFQAVLNLILVVATFGVGAIIHAVFVVHNHYEDQRAERMIKALQNR
jgi:uncharacterized membrane protein YqaE (UPF0057 family)